MLYFHYQSLYSPSEQFFANTPKGCGLPARTTNPQFPCRTSQIGSRGSMYVREADSYSVCSRDICRHEKLTSCSKINTWRYHYHIPKSNTRNGECSSILTSSSDRRR